MKDVLCTFGQVLYISSISLNGVVEGLNQGIEGNKIDSKIIWVQNLYKPNI